MDNNQLTRPKSPVTDEELDQLIWKLERDGMTPKLLSLMKELREVRRASAEKLNQPVSETERTHPNSFTDAELEMMAHGDNPQANAYRELLAFRRNSQDGWIPVSERTPEEDGSYWGWWSESKRQGPVWFIKSELQEQFQSSEITHWMPLPAAPKEVKGE